MVPDTLASCLPSLMGEGQDFLGYAAVPLAPVGWAGHGAEDTSLMEANQDFQV